MNPALHRVGTLTRTIGASLERVWENVFDWEHLPWLHHTDFASIDLLDSGPWGWRASACSTAWPDHSFTVELLTEVEEGRYVSRTLDGDAVTGEIWTALAPLDHHRTDIHVEFWLAGIPQAAREEVGAAYPKLYQRLWNEDEGMMRERARQLEDVAASEAGCAREVALGSFSELIERLPLRVELGGADWRLVWVDGEVWVHDARCPHSLGPLCEGPDESGQVECPWHGYRFDVKTGQSSDGRRLRLRKPPRLVRDGETDEVTLALD